MLAHCRVGEKEEKGSSGAVERNVERHIFCEAECLSNTERMKMNGNGCPLRRVYLHRPLLSHKV